MSKKTDGRPPSKGYNGGGHPLADIDWDMAEKLCQIFCTAEEAAALLGVSRETLDNRLNSDKGMGWKEFFRIHSAKGKASLRRKQFEGAMDGNVTMLIWLGKQLLDQKDKQEVGFDPDKPVKFRLAMGKTLKEKDDE